MILSQVLPPSFVIKIVFNSPTITPFKLLKNETDFKLVSTPLSILLTVRSDLLTLSMIPSSPQIQ